MSGPLTGVYQGDLRQGQIQILTIADYEQAPGEFGFDLSGTLESTIDGALATFTLSSGCYARWESNHASIKFSLSGFGKAVAPPGADAKIEYAALSITGYAETAGLNSPAQVLRVTMSWAEDYGGINADNRSIGSQEMTFARQNDGPLPPNQMQVN